MLNRFFGLDAHGSSVRTELFAGLTTFLTMAYIVEHPETDAKQIKTVGKTRAVVAFLRGPSWHR